MEYFESLSLTTEGWAALLFGGVVILMFSIHEFPRPTFSPIRQWPESPLTLSDLTSRRDYLVSFLLYLGGLELFFLLICVVGPAPFANALVNYNDQELIPRLEASFPLWVALALIGVMPRIPFLRHIEQSWRQLLQKRAAIPSAAALLARRMKKSQQDLSIMVNALRQNMEPYARYVNESDSLEPRGSLLHYWSRLSSILIQIDSINCGNMSDDLIESDFITKYEREFDTIQSQYIMIGEKLKVSRSVPADGLSINQEFYDRMRQEIENKFDKCCILISCAILAKRHSKIQQEQALNELGFLDIGISEPGKNRMIMRDIDAITLGFFMAAIAGFILTLLAPLFAPISTFRETGWPKETDTLEAAQWVGGMVFVHGGALATGLAIRVRYFDKRYRSLEGGDIRRDVPRFLQLAAIGVPSALGAFALCCFWDAAWRGVETTLDQIDLLVPVGLVGACTAIFATEILNSNRPGRGGRHMAGLVVAQVVVTAAVQGLALFHYYDLRGEDKVGAIAFGVVLMAVFAGILGGWLSRLGLRKNRERGAEEADEWAGPDEARKEPGEATAGLQP